MLFWLRQFFSNRGFHRKAFEEVLVVAIVSIFPLVLLPFIASARASANISFPFEAEIWSAVSSGQLYLYSFSLFGTIIWLCVEDVSAKAFPPRKYFVIAAILSAFLCVVIYSLDPSLSKPLNPVLVSVSIWIYVIYLLMYYSLLVFKMLRAPDLTETLEVDVGNLINASRNQRGEGQ
jgi:hypothetical protein